MLDVGGILDEAGHEFDSERTTFPCDVTRKPPSKAFMKWKPPNDGTPKISISLAAETAPWEEENQMEGQPEENFTVSN